jgi:glycine cleavage system aminomethyltransferase T
LDADIDSLSIAALRSKQDLQKFKIVGIVAPAPLALSALENAKGGFDVTHHTELVGEITSQVWSPRYNKQLCIAMLQKNFLDKHRVLDIAGQACSIEAFPFTKEVLES